MQAAQNGQEVMWHNFLKGPRSNQEKQKLIKLNREFENLKNAVLDIYANIWSNLCLKYLDAS